MNVNNCYLVLMAGGKGTRFWPLSTEKFPKQFLKITSKEKSLLQLSLERVKSVFPKKNIFIVGNKNHGHILKKQLGDIKKNQLLLEPEGKDTALCIAWATYVIKKKNKNAVIAYLPADSLIKKEKVFLENLQKALDFAQENQQIVTLGITPTYASTAFGYIEIENEIVNNQLSQVVGFREKPDTKMAQEFIVKNRYVWNAGIFIAHNETIVRQFKKFLPHIHKSLKKAKKKDIEGIYMKAEKISFDYAIMEKCKEIRVIPVDIGWSDIGSWKALYDLLEKDSENNVFQSPTIALESSNCFTHNVDGGWVALCGVKDVIVVHDKGNILVCHKDKDQNIKKIVAQIHQNKKK